MQRNIWKGHRSKDGGRSREHDAGMTEAREWAANQRPPAPEGPPRAHRPPTVAAPSQPDKFHLRPKPAPFPPPRRGPPLPKPAPGLLQRVVDLTATSQGDTASYGARARIQTRTRTRASTRAHAGTHTHRYTHAHARTRTHAHLHARKNTHRHTDTQAHTDKHTHARLLIRPWARGARRSRPAAPPQRRATGRTGSAAWASTRGSCGRRPGTSAI